MTEQEQELIGGRARRCEDDPKSRRHRWSDWHRVQEWNKRGQQRAMRLCLNHMQTDREWRAPEPEYVE